LYFGVSEGALQLKDSTEITASIETGDGLEPTCGRDRSCWFERGEYTANAFLPAVSLGTRDTLTPANDQAEVVRLALFVAGWVLIPLWAGSFAAVVRRE
jgi:hypothetical protein